MGGQVLQNTEIFTNDNKRLTLVIPITINYRKYIGQYCCRLLYRIKKFDGLIY